jgi:hypothetical protein
MRGSMTEKQKTPNKGKPIWKPGQSGNPSGRPVGSRNKTSLAIEALLDGEGENLTRKAIELAQSGDMQALRLCLERLCPPRKDRPITFALPAITGMADVVPAQSALLAAVASGEVTPAEAGEVSKLLDSYTRAVEVSELAERIALLEQRTSQ